MEYYLEYNNDIGLNEPSNISRN